MSHRANYALVQFSEQLGPSEAALDVPWAEYAGDETTEHTFEVPAEPTDPYLELQAYEVGGYGHEIRINGEAVSGFDVPPANGWQYWMDTITGAELTAGENTIQVARDESVHDNFAIGTVVVNWKEPEE